MRARNDADRRLVQLIFVFYFLLIFEGALRKWGIPQLERLFFFMRVPITLMLYWIAIQRRRWPRTNVPLFIFYLLMIAATILIPIQLIAGGYDKRYILLAGYGWVNYFFYVPVAFLIAEHFKIEDIRRLTSCSAWIAMADFPLVVVQFFSPAQSFINKGFGVDESNQFHGAGAALGFVRPAGFFTSNVGQSYFVASAGALLLATFLQQREKRQFHALTLWGGLFAVMAMTAFSQARGLFFMLILILAGAAAGGLLSGKRKIVLKAGLLPMALIVVAAILWPIIFPTSFEVFMTRWSGASASEAETFQLGTLGRVLYGFYGFTYHLDDTPLIGYLLGFGGNAALQMDWVQMPRAAAEWSGYGQWVEDGWSKHIVELGPILGICAIIFRVMLAIWLAKKASLATSRSGNVLPFILFAFIGLSVLNGQVTANGSINGFTWFFVGVCLAAVRIYGSAMAVSRVFGAYVQLPR